MKNTSKSRRRPEPSNDSRDALLAELCAVYADADALFAGWSCPASTECCRFGITAREPYVTSIELLALMRAAKKRGGLGTWKPANKPIAERAASARAANVRLALIAERPCPMLDEDGKCAVYAWRPLGCRTFFCERAEQASPVAHKRVTELVRRVQAIAARHEPSGDLGRMLTKALAATNAQRP